MSEYSGVTGVTEEPVFIQTNLVIHAQILLIGKGTEERGILDLITEYG